MQHQKKGKGKMRLQFKHQKFQADAAKAVVDVFAGQPYLTPTYMMDRGNGTYQIGMQENKDFTGWSNHRIIPELNDGIILEEGTPDEIFNHPKHQRTEEFLASITNKD